MKPQLQLLRQHQLLTLRLQWHQQLTQLLLLPHQLLTQLHQPLLSNF
ncbi:MAG: hypothetical protein QMB17_11660 [Polaromonas sp.]